MNKKPYLEGFFMVKETADSIEVAPLSTWDYTFLENTVAEVNIPLNTPEADYCAICMLIDQKPDYIAVLEMVQLQGMMSSIVSMWRDHFTEIPS